MSDYFLLELSLNHFEMKTQLQPVYAIVDGKLDVNSCNLT